MYNEADIMSDLTPNLREEMLSFNQRHLFEMVR